MQRKAFASGIFAACLFAASAFGGSFAPPPQPATGGAAIPGVMYASTCDSVVNNSTPTSTFCPVGTDSTSQIKRTYPAGYLVPGKAFYVWGGGSYTVPTGNLLAADVKIVIGTSTVMSITTPAAPVGTNQGVLFFATCTVRTTTTINCHGKFEFVVAGATGAPIAFNQTNTFNATPQNLIDVTGDWNGTTTSQSTTVSEAVLMALN